MQKNNQKSKPLVSKAVIPAAGLGTRLLPMTKEIPKEMLPIGTYENGTIFLKPMLQLIFERLYDDGIRQFCVITGRGKRSIEDHFNPDWSLAESVKHAASGKSLADFFERLEKSRIFFVNQSSRKGFGDAVMHAEDFVGNDSFFVHAGDDFIISGGNESSALTYPVRLEKILAEYKADAVLLAERSKDPRHFGVIVGKEISPGLHSIDRVLEKPKTPPSNLTVVAVYLFKPVIFDMLRSIEPDENGELQLTSAIELMIEKGLKVLAVELRPDQKRVEIGTPNSYLNSLLSSIELDQKTGVGSPS
jgi:UTP--glucose-1-phosphate uridylyltransferase